MTDAVRVWLRDGSRNTMSIENAVENLRRNSLRLRAYSPGALKNLLIRGRVFRTRLAKFQAMQAIPGLVEQGQEV